MITWAEFHTDLQGKRIVRRFSKRPVERSFVYALYQNKPVALKQILDNVHPLFSLTDAVGWDNGRCVSCRDT
jgi:hypothetical protein